MFGSRIAHGSDITIMPPMIGTKVVATIGPATSTADKVSELLDAGVDVVRLNFSHGSHDTHTAALSAVRQAAKQCKTSFFKRLKNLFGARTNKR